ncbi:MAG: NAD(P)H-hydrate dehydratase [Promethearchaeota archaeon]|nr:MAG: NAD(P)H-hydrate dehydratase [Candidatus Lokiarchaeota archaeon]
MNTISVDDMRIVDENSTNLGIPSILLMENAGNGLSRIIRSNLDINKENNIVIFSGTGNNGGDGFVAARHLTNLPNLTVKMVLVGNSKRIRSDEAILNWKIINNMDIIQILNIRDSTDLEKIKEKIDNFDVIIDAILGTGISGKLREPVASVIKYINESSGLKVSVDVPSGMDPDTGNVHDNCVNADITATFHKAKAGLIENEKVGKLEVINIGIPPEAEYIVGTGDLRYITQKRDTESHKGDFGKILVIGGSDQYSGAPAIAGLSAYRTGSDLVIIIAPEKISAPLRSYSPNLIIREYSSDFLTPEDIENNSDLIDWADSIIIGPGLGKRRETYKAVQMFFKTIKNKETPILIDADAIKALADKKDLIKDHKVVITPHFGEFKIFTNDKYTIPKDSLERAHLIKRIANRYNITILLKGSIDIISDGERYKLNKTGTPAMTVGGTGDCLSGIVGSLLGMKYNTFRAATAGAFLCGKAGELAEKKAKGPHIMATDLLKHISFENFL